MNRGVTWVCMNAERGRSERRHRKNHSVFESLVDRNNLPTTDVREGTGWLGCGTRHQKTTPVTEMTGGQLVYYLI